MHDSQAEPTAVAETVPEDESGSGGLFGWFKSDTSEPEPEPEPETESRGFFGFFKGNSSAPESIAVTETATGSDSDSDSRGFFAFKNPWKSAGSREDSTPEITLEADPAPKTGSAGNLARSEPKPRPVQEPPSPAASFSEKPVSDATVDAALATETGGGSGGFLSRILPGGGNTPSETTKSADKPRTKPAPALAETEPSKRTVHFESDIKPIFESKCISCHNRDTLHGRVSLESRELAFVDTPAGRIIVPGSPDSSVLFQNIISARTTEKSMPPTGHSISRKEKNLIYTWIKEGAYWPEGSSGQLVAY